MSSLFDFKAQDINKKEFDFSTLKGSPILIVNVASKCGYTDSNYKELSTLVQKNIAKIVVFPCNQFGKQEPGTNDEIKQFISKYNLLNQPSFIIMDKVDVNGPNAHPIFQFLKGNSGDIKWNFEKFLVDKQGKLVERFPSKVSPLQLLEKIQSLQ